MKPVRVHPKATGEAKRALLHYLEERESAALGFSDTLREAYAEIPIRPRSYPIFLCGTRRKILDRYPYSVIFRELLHEIEVIAIAHAKRKPDYWLDRL